MRHLAIETEKRELPNGAIHTNFCSYSWAWKAPYSLSQRLDLGQLPARVETILHGRETLETIALTTLYSQRHVFESLFKEAHDIATQSGEENTAILL